MIAGALRGRRLVAAPSGVRPTSDRVRESIFARLGELSGCRVLDLFAGTGALGIEAISRGAESLVSVDRSRKAISVLRQNLRRLDIEAAVQVVLSDARGALRRLGAAGVSFDLVFLDPPYDSGEADGALESLVAARVLVPGAVVVVESAKRHPLAPVVGLHVEQERRYGDTVVSWLISAGHADSHGGASEKE